MVYGRLVSRFNGQSPLYNFHVSPSYECGVQTYTGISQSDAPSCKPGTPCHRTCQDFAMPQESTLQGPVRASEFPDAWVRWRKISRALLMNMLLKRENGRRMRDHFAAREVMATRHKCSSNTYHGLSRASKDGRTDVTIVVQHLVHAIEDPVTSWLLHILLPLSYRRANCRSFDNHRVSTPTSTARPIYAAFSSRTIGRS